MNNDTSGNKMNKRNSKKMSKRWSLFWKIIKIMGAIGTIIGFLMLIFGPGVYFKVLEGISEKKPPKFTIQYEGLKDPKNPVYEVAEELNNTVLGKFKITVNADYKGNKIKGEVDINVITAQENPITVGKWDNFQTTKNESRTIFLTTEDLFKYSGLPERTSSVDVVQKDPLKGKIGKFNIEISQIDGTILFNQSVTVMCSPWFHSTQISNSTIEEGEQPKVYVNVKNYGINSKFLVVGTLYEIPSENNKIFINSSLLKDPWSISGMLNKDPVDEMRVELDPSQFKNKECTVVLGFPSNEAKKKKFKFEKGKIYLLETYAIKYLPYLKFPDGNWENSTENWRVRDEANYLLIFVLPKD